MDPVNVPAEFEVRSFISDCSFGLGLQTPNLGNGECVGGRGLPFERALVSSPSIVTFHPWSLRVSEVLPLLCSSTPLFPTSTLVSQNFPLFPWE